MESLEQTLRRLDQEREEADERYNDALTALDRALPQPGEWPSPHPMADESQLVAMNGAWDIAAVAVAAPSGWRGRLAGFVWRIVAPYLQRQAAFNARVVDHLHRNVDGARLAHQRAEATTAQLREEFARLAEFHSRAIHYLQQMTAYVDTRDRRAAGGAMVLNAALSGLAENDDKRWESRTLREERADARATALAAGHDELRAMLGVVQHTSLSLKRELERMLSVQGVHERPRPERGAESPRDPSTGSGSSRVFSPLDSYKYVGFEDQFRGSRDVIRARLESYLPFFAGATDVLDVGCGRGEFLELLAGAGVSARGIDVNHEMAELCRARGLDVAEADAVGYLSTLADASLGGLFAAQVVEHLQPGYLLQFLELAYHKVRPGGRVVLETLNPACWAAFFDSYIRDITHVWPLHPETLKYLVLASGFTRADLEYRSPVAPENRLQAIALPEGTDERLADLAEAFNANVEKLNSRLFTHLDYAIIGMR
jgi:O-antigen chain-terminating methyltransferase